MGGSELERTDDFQKFCEAGLDRIQLLRIRIGLGLKNFTVRSSPVAGGTFSDSDSAPVPKFWNPGPAIFQI